VSCVQHGGVTQREEMLTHAQEVQIIAVFITHHCANLPKTTAFKYGDSVDVNVQIVSITVDEFRIKRARSMKCAGKN